MALQEQPLWPCHSHGPCRAIHPQVKKLVEKAQHNKLECQPGRTIIESFENNVNQVPKPRPYSGATAARPQRRPPAGRDAVPVPLPTTTRRPHPRQPPSTPRRRPYPSFPAEDTPTPDLACPRAARCRS
eukprot:scaffold3378_cov93-Isochrysis_galbana.AAC.4